MSWPFKLFNSLVIKIRGGSNNRKVKQEVGSNSGSVQQAGRDINIMTPAQIEEIPYAFIGGTSFGGNGVDANFGGNITSASDQTLFLEKIVVFGEGHDLNQLHLEPHQTRNFQPISTVYPAKNVQDGADLYFSDTAGNHFITHHTLHFGGRADGKFNVDGIKAERPARRR